MRKVKIYIFCVVCFWGIYPLHAAVVQVGEAKTIQTLREAIMRCKHGDTILVFPGLYREGNIVIDKSIHLIGIDLPVLDGILKYEILTIIAANVEVLGFCFQNSGYSSMQEYAGIRVVNTKQVQIENNFFSNNYFGIYIQSSTHCYIKNNRIIAAGKKEQQAGNGIHCWKSDSLQIIHNTITGHRDGIYMEFVTQSVIWRNNSFGNLRYGLHFMFSHHNMFVTNLFQQNGAGVAVMYSKHVSMYNNFFENNKGDAAYGMLLKEMTDCEINGNNFVSNTTAIYMDGASRMKIVRNGFLQNGWGLRIQASCMDNVLEENNFIGNSFDVATNGTTVLNVFEHNYWDAYRGYDLNKDQTGDIPYRPLSIFSMIAERTPAAMLLFQSFITTLLDQSEKIFPSVTPEIFRDERPAMRPHNL